MQPKNLKDIVNSKISLLRNFLFQWCEYQTIVIPKYLHRYDSVFGNIEDELDKANKSAALINFKLKLFSQYLSNSSTISKQQLNFIETLHKKFENKYDQIANINKKNYFRFNKSNDSDELFFAYNRPESEDFSTLYRHLVKKLHPDIVGNDESLRKIWDGVQFCHNNNDFSHLQMFNIIVDCSEVSNIDENNLRQMSEHLDIFLEVIKQEIGVITSSELFSMQSSFDDESWVLDRKKRIRLEVLNINKKITASTNQLKEIEKSI